MCERANGVWKGERAAGVRVCVSDRWRRGEAGTQQPMPDKDVPLCFAFPLSVPMPARTWWCFFFC